MPVNIALDVHSSQKQELSPVNQLKSLDKESVERPTRRRVSNMNSLSLRDSRGPRVKMRRIVFRKAFGKSILRNGVRNNSSKAARPRCEVNIAGSEMSTVQLPESSSLTKKKEGMSISRDLPIEAKCKGVGITNQVETSCHLLRMESQRDGITGTEKEEGTMRLLMKDPEERSFELSEHRTEKSEVIINTTLSGLENLMNENISKSPNLDSISGPSSTSTDLSSTNLEISVELLENIEKISKLEVSGIDSQNKNRKSRLGSVLEVAKELATPIQDLINDGRYFLKKCTVPDACGMAILRLMS